MSRTSGARFSDPDGKTTGPLPRFRVAIPVVTVQVYIVEAGDREEAKEEALERYKHKWVPEGQENPYIDHDILEVEEL